MQKNYWKSQCFSTYRVQGMLEKLNMSLAVGWFIIVDIVYNISFIYSKVLK